MADPKEEKKIEETGAPKHDSELSDSDFDKVSGGHIANDGTSPNPASGTYIDKSCCV